MGDWPKKSPNITMNQIQIPEPGASGYLKICHFYKWCSFICDFYICFYVFPPSFFQCNTIGTFANVANHLPCLVWNREGKWSRALASSFTPARPVPASVSLPLRFGLLLPLPLPLAAARSRESQSWSPAAHGAPLKIACISSKKETCTHARSKLRNS
jgi:hypothetical protein